MSERQSDQIEELIERLEDTHKALNDITGFVFGFETNDYNCYHEAVQVLIKNRKKLGCDKLDLPLSCNLTQFERG